MDDLDGLEAAALRELRARLVAAGLSTDAVGPVQAAAADLPPLLSRPARLHALRAQTTHDTSLAATAMRMWMFSDPVPEADARALLGPLLERLVDAGVVVARGAGLVSRLVLSLLDDLFVLSDDIAATGGQGAMGFGASTIELCRAAFSRAHRVDLALDLGCGAGTLAMVLSTMAERVVATDLDPRALVVTRANLRLNAIDNVETRLGDGFAPVRGERFGLVVSQPPFVPRPAGADGSVLMYGGARGDELALRLLGELGEHLAPGGTALFRLDLAELAAPPSAPEGSPPALEQPTPEVGLRLRRALSARELDLLVVRAKPVAPTVHAVHYAAAVHPELGPRFEADALERLAHLEALGVSGITPTLVLVRRAAASPHDGLTTVHDVRALGPTHERAWLERTLEGAALAASTRALRSARLRVPPGVSFCEEQARPGADVESTLCARFDDPARPPVPLTRTLLFLLTAVHEAPDVETALESFAQEAELPLEAVHDQALPALRRALAEELLMVELDG